MPIITTRLRTYLDFWSRLSEIFPDQIGEAEEEIAGHRGVPYCTDALRYQMKHVYLKPPSTLVWSFNNISRAFWEKVVAGTMPAGAKWFERWNIICHFPITIDEYSTFIRCVRPRKETESWTTRDSSPSGNTLKKFSHI